MNLNKYNFEIIEDTSDIWLKIINGDLMKSLTNNLDENKKISIKENYNNFNSLDFITSNIFFHKAIPNLEEKIKIIIEDEQNLNFNAVDLDFNDILDESLSIVDFQFN